MVNHAIGATSAIAAQCRMLVKEYLPEIVAALHNLPLEQVRRRGVCGKHNAGGRPSARPSPRAAAAPLATLCCAVLCRYYHHHQHCAAMCPHNPLQYHTLCVARSLWRRSALDSAQRYTRGTPYATAFPAPLALHVLYCGVLHCMGRSAPASVSAPPPARRFSTSSSRILPTGRFCSALAASLPPRPRRGKASATAAAAARARAAAPAPQQ